MCYLPTFRSAMCCRCTNSPLFYLSRSPTHRHTELHTWRKKNKGMARSRMHRCACVAENIPSIVPHSYLSSTLTHTHTHATGEKKKDWFNSKVALCVGGERFFLLFLPSNFTFVRYDAVSLVVLRTARLFVPTVTDIDASCSTNRTIEWYPIREGKWSDATSYSNKKKNASDVTCSHIIQYRLSISCAACPFFLVISRFQFYFQWCHMCIWCYTYESEMQDAIQPFNVQLCGPNGRHRA